MYFVWIRVVYHLVSFVRLLYTYIISFHEFLNTANRSTLCLCHRDFGVNIVPEFVKVINEKIDGVY